MSIFTRIVAIAVALLVLVVVAIGLFDLNVGLGGRILDNYRSNLDEHIQDPAEDGSSDAPSIPEVHQKTLKQLERTISRMLLGEKTDCFANYRVIPSSTKAHSGFPEISEDGGHSITITYDPSKDVSKFSVKGGAGGKQDVDDLSFEIENMVPCIIGPNEVSRNFYSKTIKEDQGGNIFTAVPSIKISFSDEGFWCGGDNSISAQGLTTGCNFKDGGWLYTPDKNHICFFPTGSEGSNANFISRGDGMPDIISKGDLFC